MSELQWLMERSDSLAEFLELAEEEDIDDETLATQLIRNVWERKIPLRRALEIIQQERERLAAYQHVTISDHSRAPRYMDITDLELVSGHQFEHILAEILRRLEGEAEVTEGSGDQGVDVVWYREDATIGIQAKAYNLGNLVGNSAVQEIYTGSAVRRSEYSIDTAAVVTTSRFTASAQEAARNSDVVLYDRSDLKQWLNEVKFDAEAMGDILDRV